MNWVMLIYRLPRSGTSARKVGLWRKLKKLGVFFAQDSVCLLPQSERSLEIFEWLAAELRDSGGEASVWEARTLDESREKQLKDYFLEQVNVHYRRIIEESAALEEDGLKELWRQYNGVKAQDYLQSPLAVEARAACEVRAAQLRRKENP